jgi:hypothetical protein
MFQSNAAAREGPICCTAPTQIDVRNNDGLVTCMQEYNNHNSGEGVIGLQGLPPELLFKIKDSLEDLPDHASYWALCTQTAALYADHEFQDLCLRANIGRPAFFKERSWTSIASE